MTTPDNDRELWRVGGYACVMRSCCSGAELQVRRGDADGEIVLRELYPTKSDLYDRARALETEFLSNTAGNAAPISADSGR